ncbi:MAG: hypothetical protein LBL04_09815 [Bacteroidales bacterium]|jgi:hypothetical protein|nr:hypothetical protein [Bacteroidales bacterium]
MNAAINYLEQRKEEIKSELKTGNKNEKLLVELKEINNSINWLRKVNELKLKNVEKYEIVELPDMNTGWPFYRIMNDCETDDRNYWIELNIPVEMCMGDILIISKP